jgi:uncharacterized protein (TIGR02466 family)
VINQQRILQADVFVKTNVGLDRIDSLAEELLDLHSKEPDNIGRSNIGCWRYRHPFNNIDWLMAEIGELIAEATKLYAPIDPSFATTANFKNINVDYWANVNDIGSRNTLHSHKPAQFSAVYYIHGTDTGQLRFLNPANDIGDCNHTSPFTRDFIFDPKDGDLILWPSWIPHEVEPNLSNRKRINLAFDLRLEE